MPTSFPMVIPHAPTGLVTQAALDSAFTTPINDAAALAAASGQGLLGEGTSSSSVTLATAGTAVAGLAVVTFTIGTQRRVRIEVMAQYLMASGTSGRYLTQAAYNSGGSAVIASASLAGRPFSTVLTVTGANGAASGLGIGSALLAAGTYTAYASCTRQAGGSATDTATGQFYVAVYDEGVV